MKKNRFIYIILLVLAIVYASFYGGHLAYTLLYTIMLIPVLSIIYTIIVYYQFRIFQEIPVREVIKNQAIPYNLTIENNFIFSFTRISLEFFEEEAEVKNKSSFSQHTMLPKTQKSYTSTIVPRYRGTYYMGVKYLEVTDLFHLMKIKYKIPMMPRITVKPRIVNINKLKTGIDSSDSKNLNYTINSVENELDNEVRGYAIGDSPRRIHWKQVARKRELVTRKIIYNEVFQSMIIMDLTPIFCEEKRLIIEDKIIEASLAIANNYICNKIEIMVNQNKKDRTNIVINNIEHLKKFLDYCSNLKFDNKLSYIDIIKRIRLENGSNKNYIIITNKINNDANQYLSEISLMGNKINIVYVSCDEIRVSSNYQGVNIITIAIYDEIEEALAV